MAIALTHKPAFGLSVLAKPFNMIGDVLIAMGEANTRVRGMRALMEMSDEQLAERGLKRDEIAHHVFADSYYA